MYRPSRARRILKWTGTVICALVAVAFVFNYWWNLRYLDRGSTNPNGTTFGFSIAYGAVRVAWMPTWGMPSERGWNLNPNTMGWRSFRHRLIPYIDRLGHTGPWTNGGEIVISLWVPFLVVLLPTALLWYLDRRHIPPGHCLRCGYDLTGNTSGVCSECGEKIGTGQQAIIAAASVAAASVAAASSKDGSTDHADTA